VKGVSLEEILGCHFEYLTLSITSNKRGKQRNGYQSNYKEQAEIKKSFTLSFIYQRLKKENIMIDTSFPLMANVCLLVLSECLI